jgi:hypothetical protein
MQICEPRDHDGKDEHHQLPAAAVAAAASRAAAGRCAARAADGRSQCAVTSA